MDFIELDWLKRWNLYSPDAIAIEDYANNKKYSYADLYSSSNRLARVLSEEYGVKAKDRVAILSPNHYAFVPLFFALQRLGAILVPINFRLTANEVAYILKDCSPSLLLYANEMKSVLENIEMETLPKLHIEIEGDKGLQEIIANEDLDSTPMKFAEDFLAACMILYTSGTTGFPKGAMITNKMIFWNSINTCLRLDLTQRDISVSFLPFFHTGGWHVLLTPLLHRGGTVILLPKFDPDQILEVCAAEKVSLFFGVPTTMSMMAQSEKFSDVDLSSVRFVIVGGEPMPLEMIRVWQKKSIPIRQGYGLTEFGPNVFSLNEADAIRKIGSIGFPNFYIDTKIIDESGNEIHDESIGELLLKGPMCMPQYWRNEQATAETIRNGWLHTGDLVRRDAEGYFYVAGRKKEMFISGSENVYPVEIEQCIAGMPEVREVAVIGVPDQKWGEVGKAFVVLEEKAELGGQSISTYCVSRLAKFKIPKQFEFLAALPKGDSGKILKKNLH